jgi:histidine kinase
MVHLREMAKNLSLFARDPEQEGVLGETDLTDWCARAWHFIKASTQTPASSAASIELECDIPTGLPVIAIAPHRLTQIVQNLVHNARDAVLARRDDHTGPCATVSVKARKCETFTGPAVILTVTDNGIGMDDETKSRAIEPFFTTRNRPDSVGASGSGIGLALVHSIIERARGTLDIQSSNKPPHCGTTITIRFPSVSSAATPAKQGQKEKSSSR